MNKRVAKIEAVADSAGGKLAFKVMAVVLGLLVSTLLTLMLIALNHSNAIAADAQKQNGVQDTSISLLQLQYKFLSDRQDKSDVVQRRMLDALQEITNKVTHNSDAIEIKHGRRD